MKKVSNLLFVFIPKTSFGHQEFERLLSLSQFVDHTRKSWSTKYDSWTILIYSGPRNGRKPLTCGYRHGSLDPYLNTVDKIYPSQVPLSIHITKDSWRKLNQMLSI